MCWEDLEKAWFARQLKEHERQKSNTCCIALVTELLARSVLQFFKVSQGHQFSCHLKANMWFPISDQQQPRPYLTPFSHNTSVTDEQTMTDRWTNIRQPCHKLYDLWSFWSCIWLAWASDTLCGHPLHASANNFTRSRNSITPIRQATTLSCSL